MSQASNFHIHTSIIQLSALSECFDCYSGRRQTWLRRERKSKGQEREEGRTKEVEGGLLLLLLLAALLQLIFSCIFNPSASPFHFDDSVNILSDVICCCGVWVHLSHDLVLLTLCEKGRLSPHIHYDTGAVCLC